MLIVTLEMAGYQVVCPADSDLAIQLAEHHLFDLYLLDNWANGLTGVQLTERIRDFDKKVPIIFYSGVCSKEDQQKAMNAGAQVYLTKPEGMAELAEIEKLIHKSKIAAS